MNNPCVFYFDFCILDLVTKIDSMFTLFYISNVKLKNNDFIYGTSAIVYNSSDVPNTQTGCKMVDK